MREFFMTRFITRYLILVCAIGAPWFTATAAMADGPCPERGTSFHWLIHVVSSGGEYRIERVIGVESRLPQQRRRGRFHPWRYQVVGPRGQVGFERGMADPSRLRGEFRNPDDPKKIDGAHLTLDRFGFHVRVPHLEMCERNACRLLIQRVDATGAQRSGAVQRPFETVASFSLPAEATP